MKTKSGSHESLLKHPWISTLGQGLFIACIISFILWIALTLPQIFNGYVETDFFDFWAGGRAIVEGRNPYNPDDWKAIRSQFEGDWVANPSSVYPLLTNLLFSPLSLLPLSTAASVWLFLSQFMILGSIFLCIKTFDFIEWRKYLVFILMGVVLFRPTIVVVRNGQLGGLLLFLLSLSIWLWRKGHWFLGGFTLGFFALKPSLAISFLLVFGLWFLIRRRWDAIIGMIISVLISSLIFFLFDIEWLFQWLETGSGKLAFVASYMPSLWGLTSLLSGRTEYWFILGGIASLLILLVVFFFLYRKQGLDESLMVIFLIPVAVLLTPYLWNYDQIYLLIPLVFILTRLEQLKGSFVMIGTFLLFFDLMALLFLFIAIEVGHDIWSVLLSVFVFIALVIVWEQIRRRELREKIFVR